MNHTIVMPKDTLAAWLAALRSGKFQQGAGALECEFDGKTTHCCLGVLEMVVGGKVEQDPDVGGPASLPSIEWLAGNKIQFTSIYGVASRNPEFRPTESISGPGRVGRSAATVNDSGKYDFNAIADLIEANARGV